MADLYVKGEFSRKRNASAEQALSDAGISYHNPSAGHYKISSLKQTTIMFYPKSMLLIWQRLGEIRQRKFVACDMNKMIKKIESLI